VKEKVTGSADAGEFNIIRLKQDKRHSGEKNVFPMASSFESIHRLTISNIEKYKSQCYDITSETNIHISCQKCNCLIMLLLSDGWNY